jgi:hypothetical protein
MAKGIFERKGRNGDVTYYIRYQVDHTDVKERVGRNPADLRVSSPRKR